jgi:hypothetical protein
MGRVASAVGAILWLGIPGMAAAEGVSQPIASPAMMGRPVADLERLMTVTADTMDPSITVTSLGVTQIKAKGWLVSSTTENEFLRAWINRKTGAVDAQIYQRTSYGGEGWSFYNRATYMAPDGLKEAEVVKIGSDVNCSRYGCTHYEDIGITIDFATLEDLAAKYNPSAPVTSLRYRLFAQSGEKIDDSIPLDEVAAFVNVVNRKRVLAVDPSKPK